MDQRAIIKAEGRLRVAKKALSGLKESYDFNEFADHWYVFLTSAKNIYTVLDQGARVSPQSRQWFGSKNNFRKSDPLLQYLYEARNDDEHGLGTSVEIKTPARYEVGLPENGYSRSMHVTAGSNFNVQVSGCGGAAVVFEGMSPPANLQMTSLDGKPIKHKRTPATTVLTEVTARGPRIYTPPTIHGGKTIADTSPIGVAQLSLEYLSSLVDEARVLAV